MSRAVARSPVADAPKPAIANPAFLRDVQDLFNRTRCGHIGPWQYSDSLFEGDAVQGAALWQAFIGSTRAYYPLHNEIALIRDHASSFGMHLGPASTVIEFGPGSREAVQSKTIPLLRGLQMAANASYVPFDISREFTDGTQQEVTAVFPGLTVLPTTGDYFVDNPASYPAPGSMLGVFISTLPNLESNAQGGIPTDRVVRLLERFGGMIGKGSHLLVTYDSNQDEKSIFAAYDHPLQRAFGANVMHRISRDLPVSDGFDPNAWHYEPIWKPDSHQLQHTIICDRTQAFELGGRAYLIHKGTALALNNSFKYPHTLIEKLAGEAGYETVCLKKDGQERIAMHLLRYQGAS